MYLSPFYILPAEIIGDGAIDKTSLRRAKKRLMAEFELAGTPTIDINGQTFDKTAIFRFFEDIDQKEGLDFHAYIFKNKALLAFLEEGKLDFFNTEKVDDIWNDPDFVRFIAPHFSEQFNTVLVKALKDRRNINLERLCKYPFLLDLEDEGACYQKSYRYLKRQVHDLEEIVRRCKSTYVEEREIKPFLHLLFIRKLNLLPDYFGGIRRDIALQIEDLAINLHNGRRRTTLAVLALERGMDLEIPSDTKSRLNHVYQQLKDHKGPDPLGEQEGEGFSVWSTLFVIVKLIIFVMLIGRACGSSSPSSSYELRNFDNYNVTIPHINYTKNTILDSLTSNSTAADSMLFNSREKLKRIQELQKMMKENK